MSLRPRQPGTTRPARHRTRTVHPRDPRHSHGDDLPPLTLPPGVEDVDDLGAARRAVPAVLRAAHRYAVEHAPSTGLRADVLSTAARRAIAATVPRGLLSRALVEERLHTSRSLTYPPF